MSGWTGRGQQVEPGPYGGALVNLRAQPDAATPGKVPAGQARSGVAAGHQVRVPRLLLLQQGALGPWVNATLAVFDSIVTRRSQALIAARRWPLLPGDQSDVEDGSSQPQIDE